MFPAPDGSWIATNILRDMEGEGVSWIHMDPREESHDLDMVTVFQSAGTTSEMEALSVQSLLEAAGIAAMVVGAQSLPNLPEEVRVAREHVTETDKTELKLEVLRLKTLLAERQPMHFR